MIVYKEIFRISFSKNISSKLKHHLHFVAKKGCKINSREFYNIYTRRLRNFVDVMITIVKSPEIYLPGIFKKST